MTEAEAIKKGFIIREEAKIAALTYIKDKRIRELVDTADASKVFNYAIEDMKYVPFTNRKHEFKMGAGSVRTDSGLEIPVFEAPEHLHNYD